MERDRLEFDLAESVKECLKLVDEYQNVSIYIDSFDLTTLVVKRPEIEAEALFGFGYFDWKQFVNPICLTVMQYGISFVIG